MHEPKHIPNSRGDRCDKLYFCQNCHFLFKLQDDFGARWHKYTNSRCDQPPQTWQKSPLVYLKHRIFHESHCKNSNQIKTNIYYLPQVRVLCGSINKSQSSERTSFYSGLNIRYEHRCTFIRQTATYFLHTNNNSHLATSVQIQHVAHKISTLFLSELTLLLSDVISTRWRQTVEWRYFSRQHSYQKNMYSLHR